MRYVLSVLLLPALLPAAMAQEAFSPDSKTLATVNKDGIILWDVATGKQRHLLKEKLTGAGLLGFSPDSKLLFVTGLEGIVKLWQTDTGKKGPEFGKAHPNNTVRQVVISPDNQIFGAVDAFGVTLWRNAEPVRAIALKVYTGEEKNLPWMQQPAMAFSPDSKTVATRAGDGTIKLWDAQTGNERSILVTGNKERLNAAHIELAFSADGKVLVTKETRVAEEVSRNVTLWDVTTAKPLEVHRWYDAALSSDGKTQALVVVKDKRATVLFRDADTGKQRVLAEEPEYRDSPTKGQPVSFGKNSLSLTFSADGKTLLVSIGIIGISGYSQQEERNLKLYDVATGKLRLTVSGEEPSLYRLTPDGNTLITQKRDGATKVWDVTTGKVRPALMEQGTREVVAPDGQTSFCCGKLWDTNTRKLRATLNVDVP